MVWDFGQDFSYSLAVVRGFFYLFFVGENPGKHLANKQEAEKLLFSISNAFP
jgi:hypothetical protein